MSSRVFKAIIMFFAVVITAGCIVRGLMVHVGGAGMGVMRSLQYWGSEDVDSDLNISETTFVDDKISEDIKDIQIQMNLGNLIIENGSENAIKISSTKEKYAPNYEIKNGVLFITQPTLKTNHSPNMSSKVRITLKDDVNSITGECALGDITLNDVEVTDKFDIVLNLGDLKLNGKKIKNLIVHDNLGDVKLNDIDFEYAKINSDLGDVKIIAPFDWDDCQIDAKVDLGEIKVSGEDMEKTYKTNEGSRNLTIISNLGDIKLN